MVIAGQIAHYGLVDSKRRIFQQVEFSGLKQFRKRRTLLEALYIRVSVIIVCTQAHRQRKDTDQQRKAELATCRISDLSVGIHRQFLRQIGQYHTGN